MKMRILIYIGLLASIATACVSGGAANKVDKPRSSNIISEQGDEEEYELTIIDPGFQRWFVTYGRPINYYSPSYYEQWNERYVAQWNQLVGQQTMRSVYSPFENHIDYDQHVDYGVELNHELYWYFRYIESLYGNEYNFGFGRGNRLL